VVDAQDSAVLEPDACRPLYLREQHIHLIAQIADLQMPAVERAVPDLGARVIRNDLAPAEAAADLHALARKQIAELAPPGSHQIGRRAKERCRDLAGGHPRAFDDRLVIAGEEAVAVADLADA